MGKISDLFNEIRNSKKWGGNSRRYRKVVDKVNEFEEDLNRPVTYGNIESLKKSGIFSTYIGYYLKERKNPITPKGKERYEYVKKAYDLYKLTDALFDEVKDYQAEGKTLLEALESKNKGIDITNEEKEIVGEGASKRIKFKYRGKLGSFFAGGKAGELHDEIEKENTRLKNEDEKLWTKMKNSGLVIENDNSPISKSFFRRNRKEKQRKIGKLGNELRDKLKAIKNMGELNDNQIIEKIKTEYGVDISEFDESEIKKVTTYYKNIGKVVKTREKMQAAQIYYKISGLEERSVAATRLANMINMEDKIINAKKIKIFDKGVETNGVFIEDAAGLESKSHNGRVSMMSKELDLTAGSFQRDLNRLQVFDILSNNTDRNGKNFAYQISEKPVNGKYSIVGLQGTDNGMTFGDTYHENNKEISRKLENLTMIDEDVLSYLTRINMDRLIQFYNLIDGNEQMAILERIDFICDGINNRRIRVVKANEWGDATLEDTQKSSYYREIKREIANMEFDEIAATDEIVDSYDMAVKRVEEYNKKHPENKQAFPEKPENYDLYKEQKQWREANSKMVEYERNLAIAKANDTKLPEPPMGYDKYKAEKEIYTYLSQKQVYDSEIAKTGKSSMKEPKEPENFAERRKALHLQPKMDAYKEDFENNFEKQMEDYEKQVREAASAKKPLPKMPAGYLEYKKLKEMENGRVEVSLDDLSNTSKNISRMKPDANQPKHKMGMAPNSK